MQRASGGDHLSDAYYLLLDALRGCLPQIHSGETDSEKSGAIFISVSIVLPLDVLVVNCHTQTLQSTFWNLKVPGAHQNEVLI